MNKGFTLIEVIIVLAIIFILSMILIPVLVEAGVLGSVIFWLGIISCFWSVFGIFAVVQVLKESSKRLDFEEIMLIIFSFFIGPFLIFNSLKEKFQDKSKSFSIKNPFYKEK